MTAFFPQLTVQNEEVLRIAGLPNNSVEVSLIRRGIRPESVADTRSVLAENGAPFSIEEMIEDTFRPKHQYPTPFKPGRFGNGHWAVYYSAASVATCAKELAYHLDGEDLSGRYFVLVSCRFDGIVLDLERHQEQYPDLVSDTSAGYPFCQQIAQTARSSTSGLHAPSARHTAGRYIPVFTRASLSQARRVHRGRFVKDKNDSLDFQQSP